MAEKKRITVAAVVIAALSSVAFAQSVHAQSAPIVYPGAGQSMDQQARDESECRNWATQQTGVYPYQSAPTYYGGSNTGAPVLGGAARGAAIGAVGGAIGGDAGKGAAIGAGVGAAGGAMRRRQAEQQQAAAQEKAKQAYNADVGGYKRAFSACMTGRGYTVS